MSNLQNITIRDALTYAGGILEEALIPSYKLDVRILLEHISGLTREQVTGYPDRYLSPEQWENFKIVVARRAAREPITHITHQREFWGRHFYVTADTLDPRPDSETLIDAALSCFPDRDAPLRILDFGTGTGCLLLTLLAEYPYASGVGIDISPAALAVAKRNSVHLELEQRAEFALQCWGAGLQGVFDLIVSNPPYIEDDVIATLEPEVSRYEPRLALAGGPDGLDCYRALAPDIAALLASDGFAILEFGKGQEQDVTNILATHHLKKHSYARDLAGITRCVIATQNITDKDS